MLIFLARSHANLIIFKRKKWFIKGCDFLELPLEWCEKGFMDFSYILEKQFIC